MKLIKLLKGDTSFLSNIITHFSGRFIFIISKFLSIIVIARVLGPKQFAYFTLLNISIYFVSSFGTIGISQSAIYYFSRKLHTRSLVTLSIFQSVGLGGLLATILFVIMSYWVDMFSDPSSTIKILTVIEVPFFIMGNIIDGMLIGENRFLVLAFRNSLRWTLNLISLLGLCCMALLTLETALAINLITTILGVVLFAKILLNEHPPLLKMNYKFFMECYLFGLKMYLMDMFFLLALRFDYYCAKSYDTILNLGYYALITNINEVMLQLPRGVYNIIFPRVPDSQERTSILTAFTCRICFSGIWCWYLVMLLGGPIIIKIVGGVQYASAYEILIIQYPFVPFMCVAIIISGFIAGLNQTNLLLKSNLVTLIFMIASNFLLTPNFGVYGAAVSKNLSSAFYVFIMLFFLRKITNWGFLDIFFIKKQDLGRLGEIKNRIWVWVKATYSS